MVSSLVLLPTYNERENLPMVVERLSVLRDVHAEATYFVRYRAMSLAKSSISSPFPQFKGRHDFLDTHRRKSLEW